MASLFQYARKFVMTTRRGGIGQALKSTRWHLLDKETHKLEAEYGLDVVQPVILEACTVESRNKDHGFYYGPSAIPILTTMLDNLPSDLSDHVFVDIGSGKGLMLLVASWYGFKEVLGVEFARELHETALMNIAKYHSPRQKCENIASLHLDAARFEIPHEPCVLYFCNPFADPMIKLIVRNIEGSYRQHGQKIYLLFQQAVEEEEVSMADPLPILRAAPCLTERPVRVKSFIDRFLLKQVRMMIFETAA